MKRQVQKPFRILVLLATLFLSSILLQGCFLFGSDEKEEENCYSCYGFGNAPGTDISERVCGEGADVLWVNSATLEGYTNSYCLPN